MESKTILKRIAALFCVCSALGLVIYLLFNTDEETINFESSVDDFVEICYPVSVENDGGIQLYSNPTFGIKIESIEADGIILKSSIDDAFYNNVRTSKFNFGNSASLFIYRRSQLTPFFIITTDNVAIITYCEGWSQGNGAETLRKYIINKNVKSLRLKYKGRYINKLGEECLGRTIVHQINFK